MTTARQHAALLAAAFVTGLRDDGNEYQHLRPGSPEWMTDAIHAAHGDTLPCDSIYAACHSAADALADSDDWEDAAHEWADGEVSVHNNARVAWLAELPIVRGWLVDETASEMGFTYTGEHGGDLFSLIALGWYEENRRVWCAIAEACEEQANEEDEDA